jgi:hypothetical protein
VKILCWVQERPTHRFSLNITSLNQSTPFITFLTGSHRLSDFFVLAKSVAGYTCQYDLFDSKCYSRLALMEWN